MNRSRVSVGFLLVTSAITRLLVTLPLLLAASVGSAELYAFDTKEDWRALVRDLPEEDSETPVIVSVPYLARTLRHYYHGPAPVVAVPPGELGWLSERVDAQRMVVVLGRLGPSATKRLDPSLRTTAQGTYRGVEVYLLER